METFIDICMCVLLFVITVATIVWCGLMVWALASWLVG